MKNKDSNEFSEQCPRCEENKNVLRDAQAKVDELSSFHRSSEEESKKKIHDLEEKVRSLQALIEAKNNHTEASSKRKIDNDCLSRKRRRTNELLYDKPSKPALVTSLGSAHSLVDITYAPAKTSIVQPSNPVIRIRNIVEFLQDDNKQKQRKNSAMRVNFEEIDEMEEKPFAKKHLLLMKAAISKNVEKLLRKSLFPISSPKEFRRHACVLAMYFADKMEERYFITN